MGIITAEIFYPVGYTTADSEISDLGATRPPDSIIYQPSASIFNATMMSGGLLILAGSFFLFRGFKRWTIVLFPALLGIGVLGVGIFPGNMSPFHGICALVAFIAGGLSALISCKVTPAPFSTCWHSSASLRWSFYFSHQCLFPCSATGELNGLLHIPWSSG